MTPAVDGCLKLAAPMGLTPPCPFPEPVPISLSPSSALDLPLWPILAVLLGAKPRDAAALRAVGGVDRLLATHGDPPKPLVSASPSVAGRGTPTFSTWRGVRHNGWRTWRGGGGGAAIKAE